MSIANILSLLGGLALFLHGMQMMSSGLEAAAGNRMKGILEKLTANRVLGVVVGAVITAVIQSSSATTVMVVGFVNSGMMTLTQAVWIIMGANIGTTITGQLIALDVGALAPFFAFLGVAMMVFLKQPQLHHYGSILGGLGVLFIGMDMMSAAMVPLREMPAFVEMMTKFSNPVLGILAGAAFTALIQSSSASVGILQALANSGVIGLGSAVYVLFGQNIGTCITAVLASVGTGRNAKRTTIIHLMFNIIGTILFTTLCLVTPLLGVSLVDFVQNLTPGNPASQIANMHTLFNFIIQDVFYLGAAVLAGVLFLLAAVLHLSLRERRRLLRQAQADPLTGLLNRNSTRECITAWLADTGRQGALLMLDLDDFKEINDVWGHQAGDAILILTADLLKAHFRQSDVVGRIGGDEFMILMKDISSRSVVEQHMRRLCEEFRLLTHPDYPQLTLSCSVGAAMAPAQGHSFEELYAHADRALYCAKHRGKDSCSIYAGDSA